MDKTTEEPLALLTEKEIRSALDPVMQAVLELHTKITVGTAAGLGGQLQIKIETQPLQMAIHDAARKLLAQITEQYTVIREAKDEAK